jgi:DsbC/DsbD-like thiol-disulfide interchange protein
MCNVLSLVAGLNHPRRGCLISGATVLFALLILSIAGRARAAASAVGPDVSAAQPSAADLVHCQLLVDRGDLKAGDSFYAAVKLTIAPGWHIYWKNPGDAGVPTTVDWVLPAGYKAEPLLYPAPQRFDSTGDITTFGYENQVMLMAHIVPAQADGASPLSLAGMPLGAKVRWLVCKEQCLPGQAALSIDLPAAAATSGGPSDSPVVDGLQIQRWLAKVPQDQDKEHVASIQQTVTPHAAHAQSFKQANVVLVVNWVVPQMAERPQTIDFFAVPGDSLNLTKLRIIDYGLQTWISFHAETLAGATLTSPNFEGVITYSTTSTPRQAVKTEIRLADEQ